ncbi:glycine betaine ABC transporter substrate-binding protein [Rhizobium leguminosarum]|uniref:glycine betaine ABC transporter substrate-binding protein n=1 Tax=Rhizobium leguminosarum TaxID=384 RepID=UPI003F95BC05
MRTVVKLFTALFMSLMTLATAHAAEENVIKVGSLAWEDQMAISLTTAKFLEKEGFKVEFTKFAEWGIAFGALQKGDVDILLSNVDYMTADYWNKFHGRLEKVSVASYGVVQGLVVPSYMPIDSVDQLNTVADQVGGKIIGIEPGSGLMREANNALKDYDLKYQIIDGSTAGMVAQLKSSLERKEPIITMLWTPSWMVKQFDVKFLKDPKGSFAPPQAYYWVAKKGFSEKNPHAREAIATVYLPLQDNVDMNLAMNSGKTIEQAADDWWNKNQPLIEKWSTMSSK